MFFIGMAAGLFIGSVLTVVMLAIASAAKEPEEREKGD